MNIVDWAKLQSHPTKSSFEGRGHFLKVERSFKKMSELQINEGFEEKIPDIKKRLTEIRNKEIEIKEIKKNIDNEYNVLFKKYSPLIYDKIYRYVANKGGEITEEDFRAEDIFLEDIFLEFENYDITDNGRFQTLKIGEDNILRVGIVVFTEMDSDLEMFEFTDINIVSLFDILDLVSELPDFAQTVTRKAFKTMNESKFIKKYKDFK